MSDGPITNLSSADRASRDRTTESVVRRILGLGIAIRAKFGVGTSLTTYQATTGTQIEMAAGTSGAPLTAAAPVMKVSGTFSQSKAAIYGGNAAVTEGSAAIKADAVNPGAGDTQVAGVFAAAHTTGTTNGADGVGVFAAGFTHAGASGVTGYGIYAQGQRGSDASYGWGGEVRSQNESSLDSDMDGTNFPHNGGWWITANSTGGKKSGCGIAIGFAGAQFKSGYVGFVGSVSDAMFDDWSGATTSYRDVGSHTYGIDLTGGTYSGVPIRQAAWTAPTFLGTWINFGAGFPTAGYRKNTSGSVEIKGLVKGGAGITAGNPIFTLPVGYRPATERGFACESNGAFGAVRVATSGNVYVTVGSTGFVYLDNITFDPAV